MEQAVSPDLSQGDNFRVVGKPSLTGLRKGYPFANRKLLE